MKKPLANPATAATSEDILNATPRNVVNSAIKNAVQVRLRHMFATNT